jgi:hypothetical protein
MKLDIYEWFGLSVVLGWLVFLYAIDRWKL